MSEKSWNINRRTFLYGSGVACALPWLEAMSSEKSSARHRQPSHLRPTGIRAGGQGVRGGHSGYGLFVCRTVW